MTIRNREANAAGRLFLFLHFGRYHGSSRDSLRNAWGEYFVAYENADLILDGLDQVELLPYQAEAQFCALYGGESNDAVPDLRALGTAKLILTKARDLDNTLGSYRDGLGSSLVEGIDVLSFKLEKALPSRPIKRLLVPIRIDALALMNDIARAPLANTGASYALLEHLRGVVRAIDLLKVVGPEGVETKSLALAKHVDVHLDLGGPRWEGFALRARLLARRVATAL